MEKKNHAQLNMLIDVKMPTIVGILTIKSMINTTSESLKARKVFILQHFSFYETFSCSSQLSKKFIMLIDVKKLTIVGILTFVSMINTTSESLKTIKKKKSAF